MFRRIAALVLAAAGVLVATVVASLALFGSGSQVSFAAVAEKVAQTKSLVLKETRTENGEVDRILILADGRVRAEMANGNYTVMNKDGSKSLLVSPRDKTAMVMVGLAPRPAGINVYEMLRNTVNENANRLPDETLDGRKLNVFRVDVAEDVRKQSRFPYPPMKVWVDPDTRLPVRMEDLTEGGKPQVSMYGLVFDQPLDPALFSLEPPEGYKVTTQGIGRLQPPPEQPDLLAPEIKPGEGLGPAKFGMSKDEILKLFDKPDLEEKTALAYPSRDTRSSSVRAGDSLPSCSIRSNRPPTKSAISPAKPRKESAWDRA